MKSVPIHVVPRGQPPAKTLNPDGPRGGGGPVGCPETLTDWADYLFEVQTVLTEAWSLVRIPFEVLRQPSWLIDKVNDCYKEANRSALRNTLIEAKKWAVARDVPVICNEFGVPDRTSREEDRVRHYTDIIEIFEELRIPWQHRFQIMDKETGKIPPRDKDRLRADRRPHPLIRRTDSKTPSLILPSASAAPKYALRG